MDLLMASEQISSLYSLSSCCSPFFSIYCPERALTPRSHLETLQTRTRPVAAALWEYYSPLSSSRLEGSSFANVSRRTHLKGTSNTIELVRKTPSELRTDPS